MTANDPHAHAVSGSPQADRVFEHEYDGIREYDNPMPGWWVWLFVLTTVFAIPYIMWYHWGEGASVEERYEAELAAYAEQLMATYGDLQPDAATIAAYMDDDLAMTGMAGLFKGRCAQCHRADGSGDVGANLTDDCWQNVRTLEDIATVISEGVVIKGMPGWADKLSTTEIVLLSAYVARMRRSPVAGGKPCYGTEIAPWPTREEIEAAAAADAPEAKDPS